MTRELLTFIIPHLYNQHDRSEILCNLEALAINAYYLAGGDRDEFIKMIELESGIEADDPESVYENSLDELIELVGGYNHYISENNLHESLIKLVVDEEKTSLLETGSQYPIYKVVLCR